ncbi:MAG: hypothetical protein IT449_11840 [Phycisphaerales bacterium]|nr:hypothetical protein [Phycisphaerales bacterium]
MSKHIKRSMNMSLWNYKSFGIVACCLCTAWIASGQVTTQDAQRRQGSDFPPLRYADPFQVKSELEAQGLDIEVQVAPDGGLSIFAGTSEDLLRVKRLIKDMDIPEAAPDYHTSALVRLPLQHYPAHELPSILGPTIDPNEIRFAVDERNNALIISGSLGKVKEVEQMVKELDTPRQSLRVEFFFVRGTIGGDGKAASSLPAALKPVAAALSEAGFQNLQLIAPIQILTDEGESLNGQAFSQEASLDVPLTAEGGASYRYSFQVAGSAQLATQADTVKLAITAQVRGMKFGGAPGAATGSSKPVQTDAPLEYRVQTRMSTSLGEYVVLSAAPGTTPDGNALAVVIRVQRQGAGAQQHSGK